MITTKTKIADVLHLIGMLNPCEDARFWLSGIAEFTIGDLRSTWLWHTPIWWEDPPPQGDDRYEYMISWFMWFVGALSARGLIARAAVYGMENAYERAAFVYPRLPEMRAILDAIPVELVVRALRALETQ